jgi:hypothetical protein
MILRTNCLTSKLLVTAFGLFAFALSSAQAHHANSLYDRDQQTTVTGTVLRWQFINPHSGIWIEVIDEQGTKTEWSGEFQGTLDLYRHFKFNKDTFSPGDMISLTGNPARDGTKSMGVSIVGFADGSEVDVRSAPD